MTKFLHRFVGAVVVAAAAAAAAAAATAICIAIRGPAPC
jgi:hypothetical protein